MTDARATVEAVVCRDSQAPLRAPWRTALREVRAVEVVDVELAWSDGSVTAAQVSPVPQVTGESAGSVLAACAGPLADAVKSVPLAEHEEIFRRLHGALPSNTTAKCAIDLAIHEALWSATGGPFLFCGVPAAAVESDVTVTLASPEEMAADASKRVEEGWRTLKIKLGAGPCEEDVERAVSVARAVGSETRLRLDANQGWAPADAIAALEALERAGVRPELVEQPVKAADLAGMALVARNSPVPVLADESVHSAADVVRVAEAGAAHLVNVKLAKCGGLRAARDVVAAASACGLGALVGCMLEPSGPVRAAALLALTLAPGRAHDLDGALLVGDGQLLYDPPCVRLGNWLTSR
jgi:L-alanine-DL-glutamate epimerase-like enolase superfamily enzyme